MSKRLTETTYLEYLDANSRIDKDAGILRGVKLLGENSKNGRRYTREAMQKAVGLYEGRKMFINHPERQSLGEDRKFESFTGLFQNVRHVEGKGIFADAHLLKSGQYFEGILEAAEKFPNAVGFSHVADGESRVEGDTEIIESIREVFSVDLVTDPATTAGFFESVGKGPRKSIKEIAESLPAESLTRKILLETAKSLEESGYELGSFDVGTEAPVAGDGEINQQLVDALTKTNEMLLMVLAKGNKSQQPPPPKQGEDPNAPPIEEEEDEMEKKKSAEFAAENAQLKAKNMLLESGRKALPAWVEALANTAEEKRQALLDTLPLEESIERPTFSPGIFESVGDPNVDFSAPGSFANRYR